MARAATTDPRIGTELAGYRIEQLLGRGGMSVVYLAYDPGLDRRVALKLISPELSGDESFRNRFRIEWRRAASIEHPNVVPVYDAGEADGQLYIAMRHIEGTDLKALLEEEGALEPDRALSLVAQAGEGLDAAHARGLVHRDVKPSNVLIGREGEREFAYLADFGLTKPAATADEARESILLSGSSDYVSPEQIADGTAEASSDIYSLGALFYECLTGQVPYPGEQEFQVLWAHLDEPPPKPSEVNPELSRELDPVIATAMAKEPEDRYGSCALLVAAARSALGLDGTGARGRRILLLAAVALAIIAAATVAAVLLTGGSDGGAAAPVPDTSTIETIAGTGEAGFAGDSGPATAAELSRPGGIVFDSAGNLYFADMRNRRIRRIDTNGVITTIAGTGAALSSDDGILAIEADLSLPGTLAFDAAGNLYVSDLHRHTVRRIDTDGVITTVAGVGQRPGIVEDSGLASEAQLRGPGIAIDPDGVLYIADSGNNRILRVERGSYTTIAGGRAACCFSGDGGPATEAALFSPAAPAVGPDGSIYFVDRGNNRIRKIDSDGIITTVAGTGVRGFSGDGGPATAARISGSVGMTFDADGNLYFSDSTFVSDFGNRVRRIDTDGIITTLAGSGEAGFSGDSGPATEARLNHPVGLAFDADGDLYVADHGNYRIRKVTFEPN